MPDRNPGTIKFKKMINRQRISPRLWDYSCPVMKSHLSAFLFFKHLVLSEGRARVLDIGCGFKPWLELFPKGRLEYVGVDFDRERSDAEVAGSAEALPFGEGEFDAIICSEVLEHVADVQKALAELRRVAKNGAPVYITSPFMFPNHGIPHDYQRFTRYFYLSVFSADEVLWLKETNSSAATMFLMPNFFLESSPFWAMKGVKSICYVLMNSLAWLADRATETAIRLLGSRFREAFYRMPAGYSLVVRLKK